MKTHIASAAPPELIERVVAYFRPRRIILFGSCARGDDGPDSDVDLLVILDDDAAPERRTLRAGQAARAGWPGPVDVIPVREHVFAAKAAVPGTLAYEAVREGVTIYERG
jgi:predicted nucleotidyltransferase